MVLVSGIPLIHALQGKSITVAEKLLVRNSRYFADIFGSISEDVDTMVLKRHGGCLPVGNGRIMNQIRFKDHIFLDVNHDLNHLQGDEPEEMEEEPMRNVSYATMRTIVDFFESGVLKIGEQVWSSFKPWILISCVHGTSCSYSAAVLAVCFLVRKT